MKSLSKMFLLTAAAFSIVACSNDTPQVEKAATKIEGNTRGGLTIEAANTVNFKGEQISNSQIEKIVLKAMAAKAANDDAAAAAKMFQNTMAAEGTNTMNDVKLVTSEKSEGGTFIFSIEAEASKEINFQLFDEEGFDMAANNMIKVTSGKNYKALDVNQLENGSYKMYLKDAEGKEIVSKVVVDNQH